MIYEKKNEKERKEKRNQCFSFFFFFRNVYLKVLCPWKFSHSSGSTLLAFLQCGSGLASKNVRAIPEPYRELSSKKLQRMCTLPELPFPILVNYSGRGVMITNTKTVSNPDRMDLKTIQQDEQTGFMGLVNGEKVNH